MNDFAYAVLVLWIPFGVAAFHYLRPLQASLVVSILGWLFLPQCSISLPGFPDYGKPEAATLPLLLGILMVSRQAVRRFRPTLADVPMALWIASAPIAGLANSLQLHSALASLVTRFLFWGVPYMIGAMYLRSRAEHRMVLVAVLLGGVAYVPLCMFEFKMSPQLHNMVYGAHQHQFAQSVREGGYRPMVFMSHGLELSLWMAMATLCGFTLWFRIRVQSIRGCSTGMLLIATAVTWAWCRSAGALTLGLVGIAMIVFNSKIIRILLLVVAPAYIGLRLMAGPLIESSLLEWTSFLPPARAESLLFRVTNESYLLGQFWESPIAGWGWMEFNGYIDLESGESHIAVTDSLWIIVTVTNGLLGLVSLFGAVWMSAARGLGVFPRWQSRHPETVTLGLLLGILLVDCLVNSFVSPLYVIIAGGLSRAGGERSEPRQLPAALSSSALVPLKLETRRLGRVPQVRPRGSAVR